MTKIILHLGAHRTASTHVQGVLGKNIALLAEAGIAAPSQDNVKLALTKPLGARIPSVRAGFRQLKISDALETVVISDENLLGFLNSIFSHGEFYPDTARRLAKLKAMLPVDPVKIVVAIRPYESFFASAYGRWLAPERIVLPRETLATLVLGLKRGWGNVLADIAEAFPECELLISEYSPDPRFGPAQLSAILGPLADELFYNPDYRWNRSMSARQTMLYEQAVAAGDTDVANDIRTWKRFNQPNLLDGFWDEATRTALQNRYARDRTAIIERFPAFVTAQSFEGQDAR
ncbi:MAG: hypothetical protein COB08_019075 [Rhodobacteraceae bacterium]|nr:hypothetical protein [Paracoccaceae bacterium]